MNATYVDKQSTCEDIPMPIVNLNRWILVIGIMLGLALQQPVFTTLLFAILLSAVIFGQRGSLIFQVGRRLFASGHTGDRPGEDRRLMRFNNTVAATLLGLAQIAFLLGLPVAGWALSLAVVLAAGVALAGFCVGCLLYYRFRLYRRRLFGGPGRSGSRV